MSFKAHVMGAGTPGAQATALVGSSTTGLTATGSSQADALPIQTTNSEFTTVAASTGAILPAFSQQGDSVFVYNYGANALSVYPPTGGSISNGATNAAFSIGTNKGALFKLISNTRWGAILSA